jgi:hypothetical protein
MVDAGPQPPPIIGHIVRLPSAGPHRTLRLMTDVDLLLAATIASMKMNRPAIVFEPASLAACDKCQMAYGGQEDHRTGGGIAKWMEWVRGRD